MRRHVTPASPEASIPDPARGRDLPPEGAVVAWGPHWARLALRGDVVVSEIAAEPEAEPAPAAEPVPTPAA